MHPTDHLIAIAKLYPNAWKLADQRREDKNNALHGWPAWCFLPLEAWYAIVGMTHNVRTLNGVHLGDMYRLAALGAWRPTQGIYRFSPELYDALASTPLTDDLPADVLLRLPEWGMYVEAQGMTLEDAPVDGFFAHLDYNPKTRNPELQLSFASGPRLSIFALNIGKWSLHEAVGTQLAEIELKRIKDGAVPPLHRTAKDWDSTKPPLEIAVSLLLYLCSSVPDVRGHEDFSSGDRPQPKRVKHGWRIFSPDSPRIWHVGETIAEAIRQDKDSTPARLEGVHASPRPHVRRAHWHGFWSGTIKPKEDVEPTPRKFELKWLPPAAVAMGEDVKE